jgi:hypothetical protein
MLGDPRADAVLDFTTALPGALAGGGEQGRRVAVVLDRLVRMHLPGVAGRCPDCQVSADGRPCGTWMVLAELLVGWEPRRVDAEFWRLAGRHQTGVGEGGSPSVAGAAGG